MKNLSSARWFVVSVLVAATGTPTPGVAQLISLKTVPVANGDQFRIFPSRNVGMGGASIALRDSLLDPFINPAKGARNDGALLVSSPTFYNITNRSGAGRTFPVAITLGSDRWFGSGSLSIQQLRAPDFLFRTGTLSQQSATNTYAFGMLGTRLSGGVSVAGSVSWGGLNAVDGVDLLYPFSQSLVQFGHVLDLRLGLLSELSGDRSFEALLVHNRFDMTHEVTNFAWRWDSLMQTPFTETWFEENLDRTNTWGVHLGYDQPLTETGWRIGGILTGNYKSHPKIPNYEIMNIPRDPGDSWAYNAGLGLSRKNGAATFGMDLIYEPIWSNTWAEAEAPIPLADGGTIPVGGKTIENDFQFSNALIRMGVGREQGSFDFQLGLQARSISYRLRQVNNVERSRRTQREQWMEWTPSWGVGLKFPEFEVRYAGRVTTGVGRPGVAGDFPVPLMEAGDIIVAPSGPLTLWDSDVFSHQFVVIMPIR